MPLPHTAIALCLSAAAAIIFTGIAMRPSDMSEGNPACALLRGDVGVSGKPDCGLSARHGGSHRGRPKPVDCPHDTRHDPVVRHHVAQRLADNCADGNVYGGVIRKQG